MSANTKNGSIISPLFPGPYAPKTMCRFEFRGTGKERIQVQHADISNYKVHRMKHDKIR